MAWDVKAMMKLPFFLAVAALFAGVAFGAIDFFGIPDTIIVPKSVAATPAPTSPVEATPSPASPAPATPVPATPRPATPAPFVVAAPQLAKPLDSDAHRKGLLREGENHDRKDRQRADYFRKKKR